MNDKDGEKMKLDKKFFFLLGAIVILQFSFFGLKYFSVLDDNNQLRSISFEER